MSKIIPYSTNSQVHGQWLVQWDLVYQSCTTSRKRKMVPLQCVTCNYTTQYEASAVYSGRQIPKACPKCKKSPNNRILKYHSKNIELLRNGGRIEWCNAFIKDNNIWVPVICSCGKVRHYHTRHLNRSQNCGLCQKCAGKINKKLGEQNSSWRGGRIHQKYIHVRISSDNPFFDMVPPGRNHGDYGYILEHRLVMAQKIGRSLEKWEHVHHIDANKHNNQIENLQLVTPDKHSSITAMEREIIRLKNENIKLKEKLNILLND